MTSWHDPHLHWALTQFPTIQSLRGAVRAVHHSAHECAEDPAVSPIPTSVSSTAPGRGRHLLPRRRGRLRSAVSATTALALAVGGVLAAPLAVSADEDGTVTGTVFRDFNGNGRFDSGNGPTSGIANDSGVAGVKVTAYDGAGDVVGTAITTAPGGTYTLDVERAVSEFLRIEFSEWDPAYQPSGTSATASAGGTGTNGTSVQFVELDEGSVDDVDFALNAPGDYGQDQAPIITAIQRAGSPVEGSAGGQSTDTSSIDASAITAVPYGAGRTAAQTDTSDMVVLATFGEVGAIDGLVYQAQSNSVFAFASYKRMSGLRHDSSLGSIYRIPDVLAADGSLTAGGDPVRWLDVTADLGIDLGEFETNEERGLAGPLTAVADADAFAKAGKVGFGGVTLSPDGRTLYFVNLADKKLYVLDVSDPAVPPTSFTSVDLGLGDGQRPWAVSVYRDTLYVGYVDSGEDTAGARPGISAADADLQAHVLAASLDDLTAGFQEVLDFSLGHRKAIVYNRLNTAANDFQSTQWNTWTDEWSWSGAGGAPRSVAEDPSLRGDPWHIYPQAVLTSLYIDEGGYLTLGLRDRTSIQGGNRGIASDGTAGNFESGASGDLVIAAPEDDGTFTIEGDGQVGDRTALTSRPGGNDPGPGGIEFYDDQQGGDGVALGTNHNEVALGAVLGLRGSGSSVSTVYDPLERKRIGGLVWFDIADGSALAGYELTTQGAGTGSADGGFQKGGGIGAVTLLAEEAPVEIGNRVWFDADQDGIQDADEPAVEGVEVELVDASGDVIATKFTDENGTYYFRSDEDGFDTSGDYIVRFVKPDTGTVTLTGPNADAFGALGWEHIDFTTQGGGGTVDSDANTATGEVEVTVEGPGMNNHDIDAGLVANVTFTVQKLISSDGGDADSDQSFTIDIAARDFRGLVYTVAPAQVELEGGETSTVITVPVGTSIALEEADEDDYRNVAIAGPGTADADGYYLLDFQATAYVFQVTNTLFAPGTFQVTKALTGDFALDDAELEDAVFTVAYSYPGGVPGELKLTAANNWTATSPEIPYNTQVTLTEAAPEGAAPSVEFGDESWSTGDADADGSAVITIGDGTTTALTLTNPTTELTGTFQVTKDVTGPASTLVDGDPQYAVNYTSAAGDGQLLVRDGQTVPGPVLPTGTVVTLTEVTPANGLLPTGAAWGVPRLSVDGAAQANGSTFVIGDDTTVAIVVENPTSTEPGVEIHKGDGDADAGTIVHEADTVDDGEVYAVGETRDIVIRVTNTGPEPLRQVTLTDTLAAGAAIENLEFAFPDGTTVSAEFDATTGTWTAEWAATFDPGTAEWAPGDVIVGTATLTIGAGDGPHQDTVRVEAVSTITDTPVDDENDYTAFSAGIQVIKYDGEKSDPVVRDGEEWIVPAKPLVDPDQDANDTEHAVQYLAGVAQTVRWVVTNTGGTWLTELDLVDVTDDGPAVSAWTADLSAFGGPADYDFVADGTWHGLLPPGASFFAEGTLTLDAGEQHADTVTVEASPVVPETGDDGEPTDEPKLDSGRPVVVLDEADEPVRLDDDDPFHAETPALLAEQELTGTGASLPALAMGAATALLLLVLGTAALMLSRRRLA